METEEEFRNRYIYTQIYMHVTAVNEKMRPQIGKRARRHIWEALERGKGREK